MITDLMTRVAFLLKREVAVWRSNVRKKFRRGEIKECGLYLTREGGTRHLPFMLYVIREAGFDLIAQYGSKEHFFLLEFHRRGEYLHYRLVRDITRSDAFLISDCFAGADVSISYINFHKPLAWKEMLPYCLHPECYYSKKIPKQPSKTVEKRIYKIFFSGTVDEKAYEKDLSFPILNRYQVISRVQAFFEQGHQPYIEQGTSRHNPILLCITRNTENRVNKHKLSLAEYLTTMGRSDFFIAPPGVSIPLSHNIIEAMLCGAIPITNYADYMHPPLQDGINCLSFDTEEQLDTAIERALNMEQEVVDRMRGEVYEYYMRYCSPLSAANKLLNRVANQGVCVIATE